jgi:transposase
MASEESRKRRRYSRELKAQVLAECDAPGASVAKVAMARGINANIVHGWRKLVRHSQPVPSVARQDFIPVAIAPVHSTEKCDRSIEVELRRGAVTIKLTWPMDAAADLATWMRELLR